MSPITAVTIAGVEHSLDGVEYVIAIDHGRNDISQAPQASSAEITLRGFDVLPAEISDSLQITAYGTHDRFTGLITDVSLTHDANHDPRLKITAMGTLAQLGLLEVGGAGFPEETLTDRVESILDDTGLTYTANTDPFMVLLAEDADQTRSASEWLSAICTDTGATMCDLPDGNILFESYTRRGIGYNPATFEQVNEAFSTVDYIWSDVYEAHTSTLTPVELPAGGVAWEPVWKNTVLTVVNQATVTYGDPQTKMTASDASSIAQHGLRAYAWTSRLADTTDAFDRVNHIVDTQSQPRYALQGVQVLVDELDVTTRGQVLDLIQGSRALVTGLPAPAPAPIYLGVVEGWSESYMPDGHLLTLSLSDPRFSYGMCAWSEISTVITWSTMNQTVQWFDVVLPSNLLAA